MIVSNTEVTMFNTCKRSHFYRFRLAVEPRTHMLPMALRRGLVGHEALDIYYNDLKNGLTNRQAMEHGIETVKSHVKQVVLDMMGQPGLDKVLKMFKALIPLLQGYAEYYEEEPFEVVETESFHKTQLTATIEYGLRLDLLIKFIKGELYGNLAVMDHKFLYNFKTPQELDLDGQLPKYVQTLRAEGRKVNRRYFNIIRTRELKDPAPTDLYRRVQVTSNKTKNEAIWAEQRMVAEEIQRYMEMPEEEHDALATRNLNPFVCRGCYFSSICNTQLEGRSIETDLKVNYQPNTYGYTNLSGDE